jgi:hypothetical protein
MRTAILLLTALLSGCAEPATALINDYEPGSLYGGSSSGQVGETYEDDDGDGFTEEEGDCQDDIPSVNPYATDLYGDGVDQNCDGTDGVDDDRDGWASELSGGTDCDDTDHAVNPEASEVPHDGTDQNCNGEEGESEECDLDGDGYWDDGAYCGGTDCDDFDETQNPAAMEDNTNGIDDNCNGLVDGMRFDMEFTVPGDEGWMGPRVTVTDAAEGVWSIEFDILDGYYTETHSWNTAEQASCDIAWRDSNSQPESCVATNISSGNFDEYTTYTLTSPEGDCWSWGYAPDTNCSNENPHLW